MGSFGSAYYRNKGNLSRSLANLGKILEEERRKERQRELIEQATKAVKNTSQKMETVGGLDYGEIVKQNGEFDTPFLYGDRKFAVSPLQFAQAQDKAGYLKSLGIENPNEQIINEIEQGILGNDQTRADYLLAKAGMNVELPENWGDMNELAQQNWWNEQRKLFQNKLYADTVNNTFGQSLDKVEDLRDFQALAGVFNVLKDALKSASTLPSDKRIASIKKDFVGYDKEGKPIYRQKGFSPLGNEYDLGEMKGEPKFTTREGYDENLNKHAITYNTITGEKVSDVKIGKSPAALKGSNSEDNAPSPLNPNSRLVGIYSNLNNVNSDISSAFDVNFESDAVSIEKDDSGKTVVNVNGNVIPQIATALANAIKAEDEDLVGSDEDGIYARKSEYLPKVKEKAKSIFGEVYKALGEMNFNALVDKKGGVPFAGSMIEKDVFNNVKSMFANANAGNFDRIDKEKIKTSIKSIDDTLKKLAKKGEESRNKNLSIGYGEIGALYKNLKTSLAELLAFKEYYDKLKNAKTDDDGEYIWVNRPDLPVETSLWGSPDWEDSIEKVNKNKK